jgi:hypothetical protein
MSGVPLFVRAWLRYLVPLTIVTLIALAAVAWLGLRVKAPRDLTAARAQLRLGWILIGTAWVFQIWLVAGVAPAVRAVARGETMSQLGALVAGLRGLARGAVPCAVAVAMVALGGAALVVPGLVLLVLVAQTGASDRLGDGVRAAITDSIAAARANPRATALVVAAMVGAGVAIGVAAHVVLVAKLPNKPPVSALVPARTFVKVIAAGLLAISPLAACGLAARYQRDRAVRDQG